MRSPNIRYYDNEAYEKSFDLASLFCAEAELRGRCLILYGDILFDRSVLEKLLQSDKDISLVVDRAWYDQHGLGRPGEAPRSQTWCSCATLPSRDIASCLAPLTPLWLRIGQQQPPEDAHGEFIGMAMFSAKGTEPCARLPSRRRQLTAVDPSTRHHLWNRPH